MLLPIIKGVPETETHQESVARIKQQRDPGARTERIRLSISSVSLVIETFNHV